jgi:hypothetical protein
LPRKPKNLNQTESLLKIRGKFQPDMVKWVLDPVSDREIAQELDYRIQCILRDRKRRSEVFLTALVRNHIERIMFLVSRLPEVENELFQPERIHAAKTSDLIRLVAEMADGIDKSSSFLRSFVSDSDLKTEPVSSRVGFMPGSTMDEPDVEEEASVPEEKLVDDQLIAERKAAEDLSVESRQRIGSLLRKLLNSVDYKPTVVDVKSKAVVVDSSDSVVDDSSESKPVKKARRKKGKTQ